MCYTVLFVDDEEKVLKARKRGFLDEPHNCLFATDARETLRILRNHDVHVIVSDLCMPGMNGLSLLTAIGSTYPKIKQIALSGHPLATKSLAAMSTTRDLLVLTKPWDPDELRAAVRKAVDQIQHQQGSKNESRIA